MHAIVTLLAALSQRAPAVVVVVILLLTGGIGSFVPNAVVLDGMEGFAPETAELEALDRINELFADETTVSVVQVIVRRTDGEPVISADGLAAVTAITEAVGDAPAGDRLLDDPAQPAVVSFLGGADQIVGPDATDDEVRAARQAALDAQPEDQADQNGALLAGGDDDAASGLVLVLLDISDLDIDSAFDESDELMALHQDVANAVADADVPAGVDSATFSFPLLFADADITAEVGQLFAYAVAIILVILALVFALRPDGSTGLLAGLRRTVADVGLTITAIMIAITIMQGMGVLMGPDYLGVIGYFNPASQIVPILVVGLGVDYAIHLSARYRQELSSGADPEAAIGTAIRTVGIALVLATITTAVGFLTNIVSPLAGIRDFGILAAVGIVAAWLVTLTFVPSMRILLDRRAGRAGRLPRTALARATGRGLLPRAAATTSFLARRALVPTLLVTVVLGGLGAYGYSQLETRFSILDFVPQDDPAALAFAQLEEDFAGGAAESTEILVEGDLADPAAHNALVSVVADLDDIDDVRSAGGRADTTSIVSAFAFVMTPPEFPEGAPGEAPGTADPTAPEGGMDPAALAGLAALGDQFRALGLQDDLHVAADADVEALYQAALTAAPMLFDGVLADEGDVWVTRVSVSTTAGESRAGTLLADLTGAVEPIADTGASVVVTSQNIVAERITTEVSESQVRSLFVTLLAALVLLAVVYGVRNRAPMLGVIAITPVGLVLLWVFGLMAATGIPVNPVTATIAALGIGIGVPFTIHVTSRFLEERKRRDDLDDALNETLRYTGGALAGSALTTAAGFGILMTSSLGPFRQLGQVTVYAIGFSLLAALCVLPSLLALWDRTTRWQEARKRWKAHAEEPGSSAHEPVDAGTV